MQSDFLQLAIAFAGYVCIGFCVYMFSRKMLVDIDRKEQAEEILVWIFFGAVWPLGIMFAATFLLMWIFTLPGDFYRKKARLSASGMTRKADRRKPQITLRVLQDA